MPAGIIETTYPSTSGPQKVETTGAPPLADAHKASVIDRWAIYPLNASVMGNIRTDWKSEAGPQGFDTPHLAMAETSEHWRRRWIEQFDADTATQVPI